VGSERAGLPRCATNKPKQEAAMNWDRVEGKWKQYAGKVKEKWGKLTDDDLQVIRGKRDQLVGKIQERYGILKDDAERQVDEFTRSFTSEETTTHDSHEKTRGAGRG
jgi:uncharacterized protein YjbJ (UPF0337 family)